MGLKLDELRKMESGTRIKELNKSDLNEFIGCIKPVSGIVIYNHDDSVSNGYNNQKWEWNCNYIDTAYVKTDSNFENSQYDIIIAGVDYVGAHSCLRQDVYTLWYNMNDPHNCSITKTWYDPILSEFEIRCRLKATGYVLVRDVFKLNMLGPFKLPIDLPLFIGIDNYLKEITPEYLHGKITV